MSIVFDIALVALLLLTVIKHARLGLACSILDAGRIIIAIVAAVALCYPVGAIFLGLGVPSAFSGILGFIIVFIVALLVSKLIVALLSKIKIPVITKVDKLLGFLLGLVLGVFMMSVATTAVYGIIELVASLDTGSDVMSIYSESYVFKFIYDLKLFDFVRNLF